MLAKRRVVRPQQLLEGQVRLEQRPVAEQRSGRRARPVGQLKMSWIEPTGIELTGIEPTGEVVRSIDETGIEPTGIEPTGIELTGIEPTGIEPTGEYLMLTRATVIEPTGMFPSLIEPTGIEPTGIELTGIEPTGTIEPTGAPCSAGGDHRGRGAEARRARAVDRRAAQPPAPALQVRVAGGLAGDRRHRDRADGRRAEPDRRRRERAERAAAEVDRADRDRVEPAGGGRVRAAPGRASRSAAAARRAACRRARPPSSTAVTSGIVESAIDESRLCVAVRPIELTGIEPTGIESTGIEPTGIEPTGIEPTGEEPSAAAASKKSDGGTSFSFTCAAPACDRRGGRGDADDAERLHAGVERGRASRELGRVPGGIGRRRRDRIAAHNGAGSRCRDGRDEAGRGGRSPTVIVSAAEVGRALAVAARVAGRALEELDRVRRPGAAIEVVADRDRRAIARCAGEHGVVLGPVRATAPSPAPRIIRVDAVVVQVDAETEVRVDRVLGDPVARPRDHCDAGERCAVVGDTLPGPIVFWLPRIADAGADRASDGVVRDRVRVGVDGDVLVLGVENGVAVALALRRSRSASQRR